MVLDLTVLFEKAWDFVQAKCSLCWGFYKWILLEGLIGTVDPKGFKEKQVKKKYRYYFISDFVEAVCKNIQSSKSLIPIIYHSLFNLNKLFNLLTSFETNVARRFGNNKTNHNLI